MFIGGGVALLGLAVAIGVLGLLLLIGVGVWWVRRGRAVPPPPVQKAKKKPQKSLPDTGSAASRAQTVKTPAVPQPVQRAATPAPLTPASALRGNGAPPPTPPSPLEPRPLAPPTAGFSMPPPPPPFGSQGEKAKNPGPLLGFFDDDHKPGDDAKTELFSRDAAKRYAQMLDDEDDGEHTQLFSSQDIDRETGNAVFDDDLATGNHQKKLPGRVVAEDK